MRMISLIVVALGVWWFSTTDRDTFQTTSLSTVRADIDEWWSAVPYPGKSAEEALKIERKHSTLLDANVAELRGEIARVNGEAASRGQALEVARKQLGVREDAVQSEHARAEALAIELAAVRRDAEAEFSVLRKQVTDAETRAEGSRRDAALALKRFEEADLRTAAADASRTSLQDELRASLSTVEDERKKSSDLSAQLVRLQQYTAAQAKMLQEQLSQAQLLSAKAERHENHDRGNTSDNEPQPNIARAPASAPEEQPMAQEGVAADRYHLPDAVPTRVIVRYSHASDSAKAHAISLCTTLQAQGVLIEHLVEAPSRIQADSLGFFYSNDESRAVHIAILFRELRPKMHQQPAGESVPRPGLIEIEIAA